MVTMKDIDQIRRENMATLEQEAGGVTAAADRAGMSQSQWSNLRAGAVDSKTGKPRGMRKETARKIEMSSGKPTGWLDFDHGLLSPSSYTQKPSNQAESQNDKNKESAMLVSFPRTSPRSIRAQDNYFIPQFGAGGSMGHGLVLPDQPGVIENWSVSREWMNKNVRNITGVDNLCIVTGFGPSMQPMFNPGDPLLVDLGVKSVIADGVYFFRVNNEGFVKQLQKIPTASGMKYVAKSKNPDFDTFEISPEMDFEVIGRVVRVWCGTDF